MTDNNQLLLFPEFLSQGDNNTKICGLTDVQCYDNVEFSKMVDDLEQGLRNYENLNKRDEGECNCLPSCTSIRYDAEISEAEHDTESFLKSIEIDMNPFIG